MSQDFFIEAALSAGGSGGGDGPVALVSGSTSFPSGRVLNAGGGISLVDNGPGSTLDITATGATGLPIQGNTGLTAVDEFDAGGGLEDLVVGSDRTLDPAKTYEFLTFIANDSVEISPGGGQAVLVVSSSGGAFFNDKYLGFLPGADPTTLPTTGSIRFPYNGGLANIHVMTCVDSVGATRDVVQYVAGDAWRIGNIQQDLDLVGFLSTEILLSNGISLYSPTPMNVETSAVTSINNAFGKETDHLPQTVATTDATPTVIATIPTTFLASYGISAMVTALSSSGDSATYLRTATFKNLVGTALQVGNTIDGDQGNMTDNVAWGVSLAPDGGTNVVLAVTGSGADVITWSCIITEHRVTP